MPTLHRDGCRIYWRADGDASLPALVLANSLGTDVTLWDPILDALMRDFYVLRYDMRGHGGSDVTPGDYSLDQLTDDAQAVIAASGVPSFDFWGISLGGMVGMALGARKAAGLHKLVLSNTAAIVAFLACSLRLSLPPTTRWPLWLATVATLGPAAYWAIQYRSILPVLGHYFLLPFVPLPMLAITVYSVWSASATARQIDDLSTLMYKSKSS